MSIRQLLIVFFVWFGALMPASAADKRSPYTDVHSIGIISVLGNAIYYRQEGFFRSEVKKIELDWELDKVIAEHVLAMLSKQFSAKVVTVDSDKFGEGIADGGKGRFRDRVMSLASEGVDAYVIIHPVTFLAGSSDLAGLSIIGGGLGKIVPPNLSAMYRITVVDAKTGQEIDYGTGDLRGGGPFGNSRAMLVCNRSMWPEEAALMTDEQKRQIRDETLKLVTATLPVALQNANLISRADALNLESMSEKFVACSRM